MKKFIIALIVLIIALLAFGWWQGWFGGGEEYTNESEPAEQESSAGQTDLDTDASGEGASEEDPARRVIGQSVEVRDIEARHFGNGEKEVVFIGGIHGGYEWNTVLVARELVNYLESNPDAVPEDVKVTVIPLVNPDGLEEVVGTVGDFGKADVPSDQSLTVSGRFNSNNIDLNRNFDCNWQSTGVWQDKEVDAGTEAFSEPESRAVRDYIKSNNPEAVVVWYSAADGVFASSCDGTVTPETLELTNVYADASGYPAYESYDFYEITGDAVNWMAKEGISAISVLLSAHDVIEWDKNKAGIEALLEHISE